MFVIRPMEKQDFPLLCRIVSELDGIRLHDHEDQSWHDSFLLRNPTICIVCEEESQLIGFVYCGYDGRRAFLYHLGVHPEHQGKKVGSSLLQKVEEEVAKLGSKRSLLVVETSKAKAIQFYRRKGWILRDDLLFFSKDM